MEHKWLVHGENAGNVIVKCIVCDYRTSAGYSNNPNYDWFVVGRIMSCYNLGFLEYRAIPRCDEFLLESIHDR